MDDLKLFRKMHEHIDSLLQTIYTCEDIAMELAIKKCRVITLKWEKVVTTVRIQISDGKVMKEIDDAGYKYLGT